MGRGPRNYPAYGDRARAGRDHGFHALHAIALFRYDTSKLDNAEELCKRASLGKGRILSREHESYYESLDILARVNNDKGAVARAEGYRRFLPPNIPSPVLQPLKYLEKSMKAFWDSWIPEENSNQQAAAKTAITGPAINVARAIRSEYATANLQPPDAEKVNIFESYNPFASSSVLDATTNTQRRTVHQRDQTPPFSNTLSGANSSNLEQGHNTKPMAGSISNSNLTDLPISSPKVIVGIDFGVSNTVVAYSLWNDHRDSIKGLPDQVNSMHPQVSNLRSGRDIALKLARFLPLSPTTMTEPLLGGVLIAKLLISELRTTSFITTLLMIGEDYRRHYCQIGFRPQR